MVSNKFVDCTCVWAILCQVPRLLAYIAVTCDGSISILDGGNCHVILVKPEERGTHVVKADTALADKLTMERVTLVHTAENNKEVELIHALLKGQIGWCFCLVCHLCGPCNPCMVHQLPGEDQEGPSMQRNRC